MTDPGSLADAEVAEDVAQEVIRGDGPGDAPQLLKGLPVVDREEIATQSGVEAVQGPLQGLAGALEGLPVTEVGDEDTVVRQSTAVVPAQPLLQLVQSLPFLGADGEHFFRSRGQPPFGSRR